MRCTRRPSPQTSAYHRTFELERSIRPRVNLVIDSDPGVTLPQVSFTTVGPTGARADRAKRRA